MSWLRALVAGVRRYLDAALSSSAGTGPRVWWALLPAPRRARRAPSNLARGALLLTDLDGTLLDAATYEPGESVPALARLRGAGVTVAIVTSKTLAEVLPLRARLGLDGPFAVEGGAAVYFPRDLLPRLPEGTRAKAKGPLHEVAVGPARIHIVCALREAAEEAEAKVRGFAAMSVSDVERLTGLGRQAAALAMARVHSEPFLLLAGDPVRLEAALARRGLRLARGGRFFHAVGPADKGTAARLIVDCCRWAAGGPVATVAVGDAPNDLPLLKAADRGFVVRGLAGEHDPLLVAAGARPLDGVGPSGFALAADAVLNALAQPALGGEHG